MGLVKGQHRRRSAFSRRVAARRSVVEAASVAVFAEEESPTTPSTPQALVVIPAPTTLVVGSEPNRFGPEAVFDYFINRRSESTRQAYRKDLLALCRWKGWDMDELSRRLLASRADANALCLDWLEHMKGLSSATRARRLSTLRSFVRIARQLSVVEWSLDIEGPKVEPYRDTRGPGPEVTDRMLAACGVGLKGLRDFAILTVAVDLGFRRFEIAELCEERLDRTGCRVLVKGKGGKLDWVSMPPETLAAIDAWTAAWAAEHGKPADTRIFRSLSNKRWGQPLKPKTVWDIVHGLGEKLGVEVWPHGMRHTAITTFLDLTKGDVRAAQRFARHSNIQTTLRYDDNRQDLAKEGTELLAKRFAKK